MANEGDAGIDTLDTDVGGPNARAYATADELRAYAADYGRALTMAGGTDLAPVTDANTTQLEIALRQGALLLGYYADRWTGRRANAAQRLDWPRVSATYADGSPIDSATIPVVVKDANCEAAIHALANPEQIRAVVSGQVIKKVNAQGVEVEYFQTPEGQVARATFTALDDLLTRLLKPEVTAANTGTATAKRAWLLSGG